MRSADVVEKITKDRPELLSGYSSKVISVLESAEQQEVCWHMAQISPRLDLTKIEERRLTELLMKLLSHKSKIVRVSAMDALTSFAERNESILKEVIAHENTPNKISHDFNQKKYLMTEFLNRDPERPALCDLYRLKTSILLPAGQLSNLQTIMEVIRILSGVTHRY
ncbi:MAG: hypothetical protein GXP56_00430 [Deltaproteobacteria bacterium]|nr:hypothetical protein [Deltaproteobacteria bacterium]